MESIRAIFQGVRRFIVDYAARHSHPVNAVLHVAGIPMTFVGLVAALRGSPLSGWGLLAAGFLLQYVGHLVQGSEMGELTLIKGLIHRLPGLARS
jgi:uncharacterized membrane protein YGL010W